MSLLNALPLALEGQWHGWAAGILVATAALVFMGTPYVLLSANLGMRQGFHVLMVSLSGFVILISMLWLFGAPGTVPGTGPRYSEPRWTPFLAESEQGQQFARDVAAFPAGWDPIGGKYPGGIESSGEFTGAKGEILPALARLAAAQRLPATSPDDWNFRVAGEKPLPGEESLPPAIVRFKQVGSALLLGADIPATGAHREFTVFALRDKGKVFLWAAVFLGAAVVMFALNVLALARIERRETPGTPAAREPARV
ncbi:MAG: hypothetical protein HY775_00805 [Acidobacteria bacterium]|nr:hypothetical protein [Acidobacteriota bacterium]